MLGESFLLLRIDMAALNARRKKEKRDVFLFLREGQILLRSTRICIFFAHMWEGGCVFFPRGRKEDAFVLDHEIEKEKGKEERRFGPLN